MDGRKRNFFRKQMNTPFKRKGVNNNNNNNNNNNRKLKLGVNSAPEQFSGNLNPGDTVYCILCPSRKIGGVIGKGGNIVKALRQETRAKITVGDSVLGCDERVVVIYSSPTKVKEHNSDEDYGGDNEKEVPMEPCCAAQDALLKVHDRIVEEDLFGGIVSDDDNGNAVVTARLLVPNNMVGCLLGRGGDVIQRLRSGTGATIRVLTADHLPACAVATDELVQISGRRDVTKRALYEVSTLLHQNPRKDKPPLSFSVPHSSQNFPPSALPPSYSMWSHRNFSPHDSPPMPWMSAHRNRLSGIGPGSFSSIPPAGGAEASAEFSMKILCPSGKIGGVIGKGGFNVKQLQQETGAGIHVEDASTESDERVIHVSGIEALGNPRSHTIDAILQLQSKTSESSEKGTITTRLLVPSSKVGCILGQGGHVINEMRRRTQADIRVCSKDDKPKCAYEDEELVQISGNFGVAKDALAEIASRLRVRTLRDVNAGAEPASAGSVRVSGPARNMPDGPPPAATIGPGYSGGFESFRGGGAHVYDYEPQNFSVPPAAARYLNMNCAVEAKVPETVSSSAVGTRGSTVFISSEVSRAILKLDDPQTGGFEEFPRSSEHTSAQSIFQSFMASSGQSMNAQQDSYPNTNIHQSSYQKMSAQYSPYQNVSAQQNYSNSDS
ncbi:KH domain-containing protein At4g18375-like isoform X2 [Gossypium arboreum]|uniref:KH domain-containing protein At4g18375-like isoform X2 n=1 Tax=Gossypium arboreum TaxID=29729 RepID=UPI0022F1B6AE|nr:KH domain-containing protein At4g18375-like isoform X2 [Gossypium arboreum]